VVGFGGLGSIIAGGGGISCNLSWFSSYGVVYERQPKRWAIGYEAFGATGVNDAITPGFGRQTECEPCTCQDKKFTYTTIT
jgi:hypothetical protein